MASNRVMNAFVWYPFLLSADNTLTEPMDTALVLSARIRKLDCAQTSARCRLQGN